MNSQPIAKLILLLPAIGLGVASCSITGGPNLNGQASLLGQPLQQASDGTGAASRLNIQRLLDRSNDTINQIPNRVATMNSASLTLRNSCC